MGNLESHPHAVPFRTLDRIGRWVLHSLAPVVDLYDHDPRHSWISEPRTCCRCYAEWVEVYRDDDAPRGCEACGADAHMTQPLPTEY